MDREHVRAYNREWMRNYRARQREDAGLPPLPPVTISAERRTDRDLERMEGMVSRLPTVTLSPQQRQRLEQLCRRIRSILQEGER